MPVRMERSLSQPADSPPPQASLRALSVSRSFEGVQALEDVTLELHQARSSV